MKDRIYIKSKGGKITLFYNGHELPFRTMSFALRFAMYIRQRLSTDKGAEV